MKHPKQFWVVGGDMRQVKLAQQLQKDGHCVHIYALEQAAASTPRLPCAASLLEIARADCVIFPLPVSQTLDVLHAPLSPVSHSLTSLLDCLSPRQILCGGRIDDSTRTLFHSRGLTVHDYFAREELVVANTVPTAEGAIQIAMEELPITIHGARVLVIGFGRVGKVTAQRFSALGALVSVAARSFEQLAWAQTLTPDTVHLSEMAGQLDSFDLVINTVPALVLSGNELSRLKNGCLIIDLASAPGGTDMEAARQLGQRVIPALSLPGKVAPVTAGISIKNTIYNLLHELECSSPGKDDLFAT